MISIEGTAKDVEIWINDELAEINKLSTALKKRGEEDKRRELRRLDEEIAKLDRGEWLRLFRSVWLI